MIVLGAVKDCDDCKEPTKKRVGKAFDIAGPGVCSPVWDCNNKQCKRKQNVHASYLFRCMRNGKEAALYD